MANEPTPRYSLSWEEIARCIMREKGIAKGLWKVGVTLGFGAANLGPSPDKIVPAGMVAINSVVLTPASEAGPLTFDAAVLRKEIPLLGAAAKRVSASAGSAKGKSSAKGVSRPQTRQKR